jgi:hypothetical protein
MLRLLPLSDQVKDAEILALRHQIVVLERQLNGQKIRFAAADRALLAARCTGFPAPCCNGCGCWYALRLGCAGTATSSPDLMRGSRAGSGRGGRARCDPFAPWCYVWRARTVRGASGASTANFSSSKSSSPRPPSGRSSGTPASTPHPRGPRTRGQPSCGRRPRRSSPPTSSTMPNSGLCRVRRRSPALELLSRGADGRRVGIVRVRRG